VGPVSPRRRSRSARRRPKPAKRAKAAKATAVPRAKAETLLLELARQLSARTADTSDLAPISEWMAATYAPDAPLARALREDLLRKRDDKTARLALAWAREQVRLAFLELLQRARAARCLRADGDVETLAWLWLAACEALAHEPPGAVPDRIHALTAFLSGGER
jgi:hypothetical protein